MTDPFMLHQGCYFIRGSGLCMAPILGNDESLIVDTRAPLAPFDLCNVLHLDDGDGDDAPEDGVWRMAKLFLGIAALPDGNRVWTFAQMRPEMVITFHEQILLSVQRVTAIVAGDGRLREPSPLAGDHWLRQTVLEAEPIPPFCRRAQ